MFIIGCGLNYHKRCAVKIPNNCSQVTGIGGGSRRPSTLPPPRSPSRVSQGSLTSQTDDANSLVRKLADFVNLNSKSGDRKNYTNI